ncbi:hypothetical protein CesoFtcFv8_001530 [Champsocephalus esox]|uniref:Uncharacterized protein n=1 Tax=Champsocephalus esox TaxID=159716 RepID=A0AAN8D3R0_9TELE|nr:hypothetical protein CesoFtcFv8_001530 [Champsocephalus esox]
MACLTTQDPPATCPQSPSIPPNKPCGPQARAAATAAATLPAASNKQQLSAPCQPTPSCAAPLPHSSPPGHQTHFQHSDQSLSAPTPHLCPLPSTCQSPPSNQGPLLHTPTMPCTASPSHKPAVRPPSLSIDQHTAPASATTQIHWETDSLSTPQSSHPSNTSPSRLGHHMPPTSAARHQLTRYQHLAQRPSRTSTPTAGYQAASRPQHAPKQTSAPVQLPISTSQPLQHPSTSFTSHSAQTPHPPHPSWNLPPASSHHEQSSHTPCSPPPSTPATASSTKAMQQTPALHRAFTQATPPNPHPHMPGSHPLHSQHSQSPNWSPPSVPTLQSTHTLPPPAHRSIPAQR